MSVLTQGMVGKRIKITTYAGNVFEGDCCSYTQALDNEPEIDSIWLLDTDKTAIEFFENEIEKIEITRNKRINID